MDRINVKWTYARISDVSFRLIGSTMRGNEIVTRSAILTGQTSQWYVKSELSNNAPSDIGVPNETLDDAVEMARETVKQALRLTLITAGWEAIRKAELDELMGRVNSQSTSRFDPIESDIEEIKNRLDTLEGKEKE